MASDINDLMPGLNMFEYTTTFSLGFGSQGERSENVYYML